MVSGTKVRRKIKPEHRLSGWNYNVKELPKGKRYIVGLWHPTKPSTEFGMEIIYRTKMFAIKEKGKPTLRYLTRNSSHAPPHYVTDPDAFALLPGGD